MFFVKGVEVTQRWHGINVRCTTCEVECLITGAFCSADGKIMFLADCPKCNNKVRWTTNGPKLAYIGLRNDMEIAQKENAIERIVEKTFKPRRPIKPPLAIEQAPEQLTVDDAKWMIGMHIQPPEKGLLI
jgi:hypothetical protein